MSKRISDEELRAAYQARRQGARGPDCPSPEVLLAAVSGELEEAERLRVLDHALKCAACRPELALLHAVSSSGAAASSRAGVHWRRFVPLAAAASIVLVMGVYGIARWQGGGDVVRAGSTDDVTLIAPAEGRAVSAGQVEFTWHPVPGALRYTVELSAADGELLFTAQTADTVLTARLAGVRPGRHQWWVRAHMEDSSERQSATSVLEVR